MFEPVTGRLLDQVVEFFQDQLMRPKSPVHFRDEHQTIQPASDRRDTIRLQTGSHRENELSGLVSQEEVRIRDMTCEDKSPHIVAIQLASDIELNPIV